MCDYDQLDQAKKRERNRLWTLLTELDQDVPDIEQCTAEDLHKRLRAYLAQLIREHNQLKREVQFLRSDIVEQEMRFEDEIAALHAQKGK